MRFSLSRPSTPSWHRWRYPNTVGLSWALQLPVFWGALVGYVVAGTFEVLIVLQADAWRPLVQVETYRQWSLADWALSHGLTVGLCASMLTSLVFEHRKRAKLADWSWPGFAICCAYVVGVFERELGMTRSLSADVPRDLDGMLGLTVFTFLLSFVATRRLLLQLTARPELETQGSRSQSAPVNPETKTMAKVMEEMTLAQVRESPVARLVSALGSWGTTLCVGVVFGCLLNLTPLVVVLVAFHPDAQVVKTWAVGLRNLPAEREQVARLVSLWAAVGALPLAALVVALRRPPEGTD